MADRLRFSTPQFFCLVHGLLLGDGYSQVDPDDAEWLKGAESRGIKEAVFMRHIAEDNPCVFSVELTQAQRAGAYLLLQIASAIHGRDVAPTELLREVGNILVPGTNG